MHVISRKPLDAFKRKHPQSTTSLDIWWAMAELATWQHIQDVKASWPSADYVAGFVVFNISGNKYRLITRINFEQQRLYIREILTHDEYDRDRWKRR